MGDHVLEEIFLLIIFLCGAPMVLSAFYNLWMRNKRISDNYHRQKLCLRYLYLLRSLNIADLLVIFVFVTKNFVDFILNRHWYAGNLVCKGVHFASTFGFHLSSNVIVSIALERLFAAWKPTMYMGFQTICGLINIFIIFVVAFGLSVPQVCNILTKMYLVRLSSSVLYFIQLSFCTL